MVFLLSSAIKFDGYFFQDELESLRARFEKIEKERNELKIANERLESRVSTRHNPIFKVARHFGGISRFFTLARSPDGADKS